MWRKPLLTKGYDLPCLQSSSKRVDSPLVMVLVCKQNGWRMRAVICARTVQPASIGDFVCMLLNSLATTCIYVKQFQISRKNFGSITKMLFTNLRWPRSPFSQSLTPGGGGVGEKLWRQKRAYKRPTTSRSKRRFASMIDLWRGNYQLLNQL